MRTPLTLISCVHGIAWTHYGDFKAYPFHFSPFVFTPAPANESQKEGVGGLFGGRNITTNYTSKKPE